MSVKTVPGALDILNQKLGGNAGDIPASSTKEYALEKIYRTLGGEESLEGVNTTSEIIEKIAGVAEGGGGSSDFSTAEITIVNSEAPDSIPLKNIDVNWPAVYNDVFNFPLAEPMSIPVPSTIKIPLYKGQLVYTIGGGADSGDDFLVRMKSIINTSGNIILDPQDRTITISGNGTIEVSGAK